MHPCLDAFSSCCHAASLLDMLRHTYTAQKKIRGDKHTRDMA